MYQDSGSIMKKYREQGYRYLGSVNMNPHACEAYTQSKQYESFTIGRCLQLVVLHDIKAMVEIDSGD